jgi:hypothetical protein
MLSIDGCQFSSVEQVPRTVGPEFANDLTLGWLNLLTAGKQALEPHQQLFDIGSRRVDDQRRHLLKPVVETTVEAPLNTVGEHRGVPLAGPLAISGDIAG